MNGLGVFSLLLLSFSIAGAAGPKEAGALAGLPKIKLRSAKHLRADCEVKDGKAEMVINGETADSISSDSSDGAKDASISSGIGFFYPRPGLNVFTLRLSAIGRNPSASCQMVGQESSTDRAYVKLPRWDVGSDHFKAGHFDFKFIVDAPGYFPRLESKIQEYRDLALKTSSQKSADFATARLRENLANYSSEREAREFIEQELAQERKRAL